MNTEYYGYRSFGFRRSKEAAWLTGPNRLITKALFESLLGADAIKVHPDRAADMIRGFTEVDQDSMRRTVRFMHRWRR